MKALVNTTIGKVAILGALVALVALLTPLPTMAQASNAVVAERVRVERQIAQEIAPVKNYGDLQSFIQRGGVDSSPLSKLSPEARQRFLKSLRFSERGLSSYRYVDLESELSVSEAYQVLALFGQQHTVKLLKHARVSTAADALIRSHFGGGMVSPMLDDGPEADYPDRECVKRATCGSSPTNICIGNNC